MVPPLALDPMTVDQDATDEDATLEEEWSDDPAENEHWARRWGLGRLLAIGAALVWLGFGLGYFVANAGSVPDENSADVGYLQDMITHHEQALTMAQYGLANGDSSEVKTFAREILLFQSYEIGLMENKLNSWGFSRQNRSETAMAWMGMGMPVESMPGLATDDQMNALALAEGLESDVIFLELMAAHHRGGADMGLAAADRILPSFLNVHGRVKIRLTGPQTNNIAPGCFQLRCFRRHCNRRRRFDAV